MKGLAYGSDSDEEIATDDVFGISSIQEPASKRQRLAEQPVAGPSNITAAPNVLAQDPLKQTSLVTRPTDTQMKVNITYEDMMAPVVGPENPFGERRFLNQNTLAGHVEEQSMSEHAFKTQYLTHHILGYSANPSNDPSAPRIIGSVEKAEANGLATIDALRPSRQTKKELKRKRNGKKGDLDVVEGEGSYVGPWGGWEGDGAGVPVGPEPTEEDEEEDEEEAKEAAAIKSKAKVKRSVFGQETSIFHGKSLTDYQGRTYMSPPLAVAPHLSQESGSQETYIPKVCVHTWTGHTQGVSVIRTFPGTGHLLLSGSMDTKIKLWDVYQEGNCLRTFMGHHKAVKDVTFSNDGRRFLSCGYDRQMKLWDTETGQCLKAFSNGKIPHCIRFHPDEDKQNIFLAGMSDKKIIQYDMNTGEITQEYDQHLGPVNTITFVDENRRFITTSDDKTMRAWDFDIPVVIKYIAEPDMHSMPAVTLHPSKKWLAAQSLDNQICIYSAENFRQNRKKRFAGHTIAGYACQVGFSPDGKWISSGDSDGNVVFWDWKTGRIKSRLKAHSKVVIAHEWLPHETSKVITASWDGLIKLWQTSYLFQPAFSLAAAAAMTWFVAVVARHCGALDRRSRSAELPATSSDAFVPKLSYAADTKSYSPGDASQSPVISPHPAGHPRVLRLPVYRPIKRPTAKYPVMQRSFCAMLEEDSSEKEVVGESVERTSTACPHEKSAGEELSSEMPHDNRRPPPTPPDLVPTFDEELPETSEDLTYETWRKVFRAKFRRIRPRGEAQPQRRLSSSQAEGPKEGSNHNDHETPTQATFAWNCGPVPVASRQPTIPICAPSVPRYHLGVRNPGNLFQFTNYPPVATLQEDVEMIEEGGEVPDCSAPYPPSENPMEIDAADMVPDIEMVDNEMSPLTSAPPVQTWIQSSEQLPFPFGSQWAGEKLPQKSLDSLNTFAPGDFRVGSLKDDPCMDIDFADDVEMATEEQRTDVQEPPSAPRLLQTSAEPIWSMATPPSASRVNETPQLPSPMTASEQYQGAVSLPPRITLTESVSPAQMQTLPLVWLEPAYDVYYPAGPEQSSLFVHGAWAPFGSPAASREDRGDCIPPPMSLVVPTSSRQPLDGGVSSVNSSSLNDLPALSFTPSTGRLTLTGPWDLSVPTPSTGAEPDVSLFPSPGVAPGGNMNSIPELDVETFMAEAIKGSPSVITQPAGPAVGIDIGFVNLTGDDFLPYEDVAGGEDEDSNSDEDWEEIIVPTPLGLNPQEQEQVQVPLVPSIAVTREELVITLDLEGEENG